MDFLKRSRDYLDEVSPEELRAKYDNDLQRYGKVINQDDRVTSLMPDEMAGFVPGGNLALAARDINDGNYTNAAASLIPGRIASPAFRMAMDKAVRDLSEGFAPQAVTPEGISMKLSGDKLPDTSVNEAVYGDANWQQIRGRLKQAHDVMGDPRGSQEGLAALDEINRLGKGETPAPEGVARHDFIEPLKQLRGALYGDDKHTDRPAFTPQDKNRLASLFDKPEMRPNDPMAKFVDAMIGGHGPAGPNTRTVESLSVPLDQMNADMLHRKLDALGVPREQRPFGRAGLVSLLKLLSGE